MCYIHKVSPDEQYSQQNTSHKTSSVPLVFVKQSMMATQSARERPSKCRTGERNMRRVHADATWRRSVALQNPSIQASKSSREEFYPRRFISPSHNSCPGLQPGWASDEVRVANCARGSSSICHVAASEAHQQAWKAEGHPAPHPRWDRICKQNQASRDITTLYYRWANHALLNLTLKTSDVMHLRPNPCTWELSLRMNR
jgi:hypothetical protein